MITQLVTPGPNPVSNLYFPPEKMKSYKSDLSHSNSTNNVRLIFRALGHRNYRLFFSGQGISLIGTWMQQIAMNWLVFRLTDSAVLLGVVGFMSRIPTFLLAPFAGVLADRWNRHRVLVITQTLSMIQAMILAILVLTGKKGILGSALDI